MNCPKCGNNTAHRAHRKGLDRTVSWLGFKPYRCKECGNRFYAYRDGERSERLRTPEERKVMKLRRRIRWRRTRAEVVLYTVGSLVIAALIWYLLREPAG